MTSAAATAILSMDADRDLHRYQRHARGDLPPEVRDQCRAVVRALSQLAYLVDEERGALWQKDDD